MMVAESCFSSVGKGNLARVDGMVDGAKYRVTPKENVKSGTSELTLEHQKLSF